MANNSYGEKCVAAILYREHIKFYREYEARGMFGPNGRPQRFDFWLPDYGVAIEVDGIQHYQVLNGDYRRFSYQRACDIRKNKYCLLHDINLYRIPSEDIVNITSFQELVSEKYLVYDLEQYTPQENYTPPQNYAPQQYNAPQKEFNTWTIGFVLFIVFVIIPLVLLSPFLLMILR